MQTTSDKIGDSTEPACAAVPRWLCGWLFAVGLAATVFLVYRPAWHGEFILDDEMSIDDNPALKLGLLKAWEPNAGVPGGVFRYWPLTFTAFKVEHDLWAREPLGYHLVNLALHAAAALLT